MKAKLTLEDGSEIEVEVTQSDIDKIKTKNCGWDRVQKDDYYFQIEEDGMINSQVEENVTYDDELFINNKWENIYL